MKEKLIKNNKDKIVQCIEKDLKYILDYIMREFNQDEGIENIDKHLGMNANIYYTGGKLLKKYNLQIIVKEII